MWNWYLFHDPFTFAAFWMYFTCATASCKRAPFDLAEAESELVAGFHTEYSGFRWLTIFMAEYGSMFAVSAIASLMFLGGWNTGILPWELSSVLGIGGNVINVIVLITKAWILVFVMMWVRWTLPRLRIDQVMMTCLKYLLPISCVLLVGVSSWQVFVPNVVEKYFYAPMFGVMALLLVWGIIRLMTYAQKPPSSGMPGMWRTASVSGYQGARPS